MDWKNIKANDDRGHEFILGMMAFEEKQKVSRKLFNSFINANGFTTWHVHNGWVTYNFSSGDVLHNTEIDLTWIPEQAGYYHSDRCPNIGEKLVIVKDSPNTEKVKPFDLFCYEVIDKPKPRIYQYLKLKLIDVRQVIFNQEDGDYGFYIKPIGKFNSFLNKLKSCKNPLAER